MGNRLLGNKDDTRLIPTFVVQYTYFVRDTFDRSANAMQDFNDICPSCYMIVDLLFYPNSKMGTLSKLSSNSKDGLQPVLDGFDIYHDLGESIEID